MDRFVLTGLVASYWVGSIATLLVLSEYIPDFHIYITVIPTIALIIVLSLALIEK